MKVDTLNISEDFYSVQGEGKTSGAYFNVFRFGNFEKP